MIMPQNAPKMQGSSLASSPFVRPESQDFESTALQCGIDPDAVPPTVAKSGAASQSDSENSEAPKPPFIWLDDFCQLPPETNWLVRGYLEQDSLAAFFGDSEAGKSFVMVDLACHIAHGLPWCGKKVTQCPVLYIAGEGGSGLRRRFKAWHEYHGLPVTPNIAVRTVAAALCEPKATAQLLNLIKDHLVAVGKKPGLIVLDTLNRNFGAGDENNTAHMTAFTQGMDALRTATGACIAPIHHCGHSDKGRMRAAISLHNAVDFEYLVERTGDRKELSSLRTSLSATKCKDSENPPSLTWAWKLQSLPWLELDDNDFPVPISSCVLVQDTNPQPEQPKPECLPKAQRIALDALRTTLIGHGVEDKGVVSVGEDQWREAAYEAGISRGKQEAKRQVFVRASRGLIETGKVRCHEGRFWIPKPTPTQPYTTLQSMDMSVGCREADTYTPLHGSLKPYGCVGATDNPDFEGYDPEPDLSRNDSLGGVEKEGHDGR